MRTRHAQVGHEEYAETLCSRLTRWLKRKSRALEENRLQAALVLLRINLDPVRSLLASLYCPDPRGRKPFDPLCMLRALLLMVLLQVESLPKFAEKLKRSPRLAHIAGFAPRETPSASAFYDFLDRLEDGAYTRPCPATCDHACVKPSRLRRGKHRRNLKTEKQQRQEDSKQTCAAHDSVTQKLKTDLQATAHQPRPRDLQQRLEDILIQCAVIPSAQRGLLGDISKLSVAGDGTALVTSASPHGTPTCTCRQEGIYRCDCDRFYTDPTANWGYNSYRDCYYFGHTLYQHVVSTEGHDLPLHIGIGPASETDYTLSLKSLDRLGKALRENGLSDEGWRIQNGIYDCGHDATGIYEYLLDADITPVIPLNPRSGEFPKPTGNACQVNEEGIPLCKAGIPMRRCSHDKKKHRVYYNCPVKRPTHRNGKYQMLNHEDECPLGTLCHPDTKMSPVVYVKTTDDPRLYPPLPRSSDQFKTLMKLRSGTERSNAHKKETYKLGKRVARNATHFLIRATLISIIEHAKAWLAEDKNKLGDEPIRLMKTPTTTTHLEPETIAA